MMSKLWSVMMLLLACVIVVSSVTVAQEAPLDSEIRVVADVAAAPPWWLDAAETGLNYLWKLAIPAFFAWLIKKAGDNQAMKDALQALEAGVNDAYGECVRKLKAAHADGKMSDEERDQCLTWARNKAEEVATGPGKKVLLRLGEMGMNALIEKIIRRNKAEGKK